MIFFSTCSCNQIVCQMCDQSIIVLFFPPTSSTGVKVLLTFRMINVRHYSLKKTKQLGCISKKNEYNIYKFWILNFFFDFMIMMIEKMIEKDLSIRFQFNTFYS